MPRRAALALILFVLVCSLLLYLIIAPLPRPVF